MPFSEACSAKAWITASHRSGSMVGCHHEEGNQPTKPDQDKDSEAEKWRKKKWLRETNMRQIFLLASIKMRKKRDIFEYIFEFCLFPLRKGQNPNVLFFVGLDFYDWFALYECCGLSASFLLHSSSHRPLASVTA